MTDLAKARQRRDVLRQQIEDAQKLLGEAEDAVDTALGLATAAGRDLAAAESALQNLRLRQATAPAPKVVVEREWAPRVCDPERGRPALRGESHRRHHSAPATGPDSTPAPSVPPGPLHRAAGDHTVGLDHAALQCIADLFAGQPGADALFQPLLDTFALVGNAKSMGPEAMAQRLAESRSGRDVDMSAPDADAAFFRTLAAAVDPAASRRTVQGVRSFASVSLSRCWLRSSAAGRGLELL